MYRITSSLLINGLQVQKFIQEILPEIQTWEHNGTVIDMSDQELERMLKKLVRARRAALSSITADEERADETTLTLTLTFFIF